MTRSSVSFHTANNSKVAIILQQSPFKSPAKSHQKQNRNCVIGPFSKRVEDSPGLQAKIHR